MVYARRPHGKKRRNAVLGLRCLSRLQWHPARRRPKPDASDRSDRTNPTHRLRRRAPKVLSTAPTEGVRSVRLPPGRKPGCDQYGRMETGRQGHAHQMRSTRTAAVAADGSREAQNCWRTLFCVAGVTVYDPAECTLATRWSHCNACPSPRYWQLHSQAVVSCLRSQDASTPPEPRMTRSHVLVSLTASAEWP